jgi:hypothetical protein
VSEQLVYCDKWIDPEAIDNVRFDLLRAAYDDLKAKVAKTVGDRPVVGRPVLVMRYEVHAEFAPNEIVFYRDTQATEPAP